MDIALARQILQTVITQKETELETLRLSHSILADNFVSEFENLETTTEENRKLAIEANEARNIKIENATLKENIKAIEIEKKMLVALAVEKEMLVEVPVTEEVLK